ncbi:MAG: sterol desaturase family protein [Bacteroidia bacterium]|nr:sterol desaturase family protein [Nitrosopumilus sp.]
MGKFVTNKNETVRLFENPVLEYFSHIHPLTPVVTYVPVAALLVWLGLGLTGLLYIILFFAIGLLLWSLTEYVIHRWAFHYQPTTEIGKKVHFLVHGVHHDYPRDATRLVMPLLVSIPLALVFYFFFKAVFADFHFAVFSGFISGYVAYDSIHYATHHMKMEGRIGRFLKRYHLKHHYNDEHTAYGVSTPLWDYVFGTIPDELKGKK